MPETSITIGTRGLSLGFLKPYVRQLRSRLYDGLPNPYHQLVKRLITERTHPKVLVFGAGRGRAEPDLTDIGAIVTGVDISTAVRENPRLNHAVLYGGGRLPFRDQAFDLCCCHQVIEHLPFPEAAFSEISRVLRPGGHFVFRTSNAWFYAFIAARLVPNALHPAIVRLATGRAERDTFPTLFRANTRRRLRRMLSQAGLKEVRLEMLLQGADYLEFSLPTFLVGVAFERLVNLSSAFEVFRQFIIGDFAKPSATGVRSYQGGPE